MFKIEISYSSGECEDKLYGEFKTEEEAFKEMCNLAVREAYTQNEEFLENRTCEVYFNAFKKEIDLHYNSDDTWCYYRVKQIERS